MNADDADLDSFCSLNTCTLIRIYICMYTPIEVEMIRFRQLQLPAATTK